MEIGHEPVNLTTAFAMEDGKSYTFQNTSPTPDAVVWIDVREAAAAQTDNEFVATPRQAPWTLDQKDELVFFARSGGPEEKVYVSLIEQ